MPDAPSTPSTTVRIAAVAVGLAVLGATGWAALDLAGARTDTAAVAAPDLAAPPTGAGPGIGAGVDGRPVRLDVPDGWVRADPGVDLPALDGVRRVVRGQLEELRRGAAARGAVAFAFDLESRGHVEVTHVPAEGAVVSDVADGARRQFSDVAGVELRDDRPVEVGSGQGHLFRYTVATGGDGTDSAQVIVPYDGGYAVFVVQSLDPAAVDEVLAGVESFAVG